MTGCEPVDPGSNPGGHPKTFLGAAMSKVESELSSIIPKIRVTAKAVRIAKETHANLMKIAAAMRKKLEHPVKLKISKAALEDLVATHGADIVEGLERDFKIDILTSAALDGSRKAYDELLKIPEGVVRVDRMKIKKP